MNPRRIVESFGSPHWTQQSDSRMCAFDVKVNGEQEAFHLILDFPKTILVTFAHHLGGPPAEKDLEAIARVWIGELVSNGKLDHWPVSFPKQLPPIDYTNIQSLIHNARQRGWLG